MFAVVLKSLVTWWVMFSEICFSGADTKTLSEIGLSSTNTEQWYGKRGMSEENESRKRTYDRKFNRSIG
jgi:hypothetical protein